MAGWTVPSRDADRPRGGARSGLTSGKLAPVPVMLGRRRRPDLEARLRRYRRIEEEAGLIHRALAEAASDTELAELFTRLAEAEEKQAKHWRARLDALGVPTGLLRPGVSARFARFLITRFGLRASLPFVEILERREVAAYRALGPPASSHAEQERGHAALVARARRALRGTEWAIVAGRSGVLRAAVFGASDGLVSNLALVTGVTAAGASHRIVILAGVTGLLAGALSMGAGEYLSMRVQRELFEHLLAVEAAEADLFPEHTEQKLTAALAARGIPEGDAARLAGALATDPRAAFELRAREVAGLDPEELGSPLGAGLGSFLAFSAGAVIPVLPFVLGLGAALRISVAAGGVGLFLAGAASALLTGQAVLTRGLRMLFIGGGAATLTYATGRAFGVVAG